MKNKKAFTLVELIVVITILSILATIWFIWYSSYLGSSRDTNRVSQLKNISQSLEIYGTKKSLPLPEDSVEIKTWAKIIAYQWYVWENIIEQINYSTEGIDPQSWDYFSYYLTKDKKYFQLMAFLEDWTELQNKSAFNISRSYADYTDKFPTVYWKKLWILTDIDNTPIQEIASIKTAWFLDISNVWTDEYIARFSDKSKLTWSWTSLAVVNPVASCKRIYEAKWKRENWVYKIDPEGNWTGFEVYCDMTTDWGGWVRVISKKPALDFEKLWTRTSWIFSDSKCDYSLQYIFCNYDQLSSLNDYWWNNEFSFDIPLEYTELYYKIKIDLEKSSDLWKFEFKNNVNILKFADGSSSWWDNNVYSNWSSIWECKDWCEGKMTFLSSNWTSKINWTDYQNYSHQKVYIDYLMVR